MNKNYLGLVRDHFFLQAVNYKTIVQITPRERKMCAHSYYIVAYVDSACTHFKAIRFEAMGIRRGKKIGFITNKIYLESSRDHFRKR